MHFTHIDHLASIIERGLLCDTIAGSGYCAREAGNPDIKAGRRLRRVEIHPFGCVADYVPFYFAPRSPMMSAISHGRVPHFGSDVTGLMYLVTTTQILVDAASVVLVTDRNAKLDVAEFRPEADCDELVDWDLMEQTYWANTLEDPDRRERRMAECLVHRVVRFDKFRWIVVHGAAQRKVVESVLDAHGMSTPVLVRPNWYI
jgi:hypothetical protein